MSLHFLPIRYCPLLLCGFSLVAHSSLAVAQYENTGQAMNELLEMNLEELINIEITSVTKTPQKASEAAAAVFVITQTDIKRSGVTNIPEALRLAPGIDVARIDGNKWAISSRGFTGRFANKLLVLIDGRSVYTPYFSGVYWDVQDVLLEDIDRIEVIRGPGATLWGANAVNGVINIITRTTDQTQGTYLTAGGGTKERVFGAGRYGGKLGELGHFRVYGKYFERANNEDYKGEQVNDDWRIGQGGFRTDLNPDSQNHVTIQGDVYDGSVGGTVTVPNFATLSNDTVSDDNQVNGGNLILRWNHQLNASDTMQWQIYYDYTQRKSVVIENEHNTLDVDFQHNFSAFDNQNVVWGGGYRFISDNINSSSTIVSDPQRDLHLFSLFIQDEVNVVDQLLKLTFGSKFEHNDLSGLEIQPSFRFLLTPGQHTFWGSIARAVRTPSRGERTTTINQPFQFNTQKPVLTQIDTDIGRNSEELIAYELGYRISPTENLSVDLALFYNDYDNLRNLVSNSRLIDAGNYWIYPTKFETQMQGESYGAELHTIWKVRPDWKLSGNYSYQHLELHTNNSDSHSEHLEHHIFNHKLSIRSSMNIRPDLDLDLWFKYAWFEDPDQQHLNQHSELQYVNDLLTLDVRLAWRPIQEIELSVTGQNLLNDKQMEYYSDFIQNSATEVERSLYGQIEFRF